jgi:hypothetical protein
MPASETGEARLVVRVRQGKVAVVADGAHKETEAPGVANWRILPRKLGAVLRELLVGAAREAEAGLRLRKEDRREVTRVAQPAVAPREGWLAWDEPGRPQRRQERQFAGEKEGRLGTLASVRALV